MSDAFDIRLAIYDIWNNKPVRLECLMTYELINLLFFCVKKSQIHVTYV
jgi:hypothetical protein